jgi:AcrR family transcriptional regulator
MASTAKSVKSPPPDKSVAAPDRLLNAALESFAEIGYHATTTRNIAERAGMSPAAVYVHYRSKLDLLHAISKIGHESAQSCLEAALATPGTHEERLGRAVEAFARWHAENRTLARVIQYEYVALSKPYREEIKAVRRRMQEDVEEEIRQGIAAGEFATADVAGTALAIVSLCVDIARWFNPQGDRSTESVGTLYAQLALRMLAPPANGTRPTRRRRAEAAPTP